MKMVKESLSNTINRIGSPKNDIKSLVGIMKGMDIGLAKKEIKK